MTIKLYNVLYIPIFPFADPNFYSIFLLLLVSGGILTYSQFLCASVCSALTASLVGVAKSVLQTVIGLFTFGGIRFHPLNVIGKIVISNARSSSE